MKYKILGIVLGLGALGYVFREKVVEFVNGLLDKVDAMIEDQTPDPDPEVPDNVEGFGIPGSRAYPREQG